MEQNNKKKKKEEVIFKYTDAVSNSNKLGRKKKTGNISPSIFKETYITPRSSLKSSLKSSSKTTHIASTDTLHQQSSMLSLNKNDSINIDTKQAYVNYFINKNWNNLDNYLPFYEIELFEEDGESDYENDLCDY